MQALVKRDGNTGLVKVSGRFDFQSHKGFKEVVEPMFDDAELRLITIDLRECDYLDSSALGMLLLSKQKSESRGKDIELVAALGSTPRQVLAVANFDKLFSIVD